MDISIVMKKYFRTTTKIGLYYKCCENSVSFYIQIQYCMYQLKPT